MTARSAVAVAESLAGVFQRRVEADLAERDAAIETRRAAVETDRQRAALALHDATELPPALIADALLSAVRGRWHLSTRVAALVARRREHAESLEGAATSLIRVVYGRLRSCCLEAGAYRPLAHAAEVTEVSLYWRGARLRARWLAGTANLLVDVADDSAAAD